MRDRRDLVADLHRLRIECESLVGSSWDAIVESRKLLAVSRSAIAQTASARARMTGPVSCRRGRG